MLANGMASPLTSELRGFGHTTVRSIVPSEKLRKANSCGSSLLDSQPSVATGTGGAGGAGPGGDGGGGAGGAGGGGGGVGGPGAGGGGGFTSGRATSCDSPGVSVRFLHTVRDVLTARQISAVRAFAFGFGGAQGTCSDNIDAQFSPVFRRSKVRTPMI